MNDENDHDYFRVTKIRSTAQATLYVLAHNNREFWVPNKLHEYRPAGDTIEVEAWFAKKEGMHDD